MFSSRLKMEIIVPKIPKEFWLLHHFVTNKAFFFFDNIMGLCNTIFLLVKHFPFWLVCGV